MGGDGALGGRVALRKVAGHQHLTQRSAMAQLVGKRMAVVEMKSAV